MISKQTKKLALFLPGLYGGGAERILINLAAELAERSVEVDLVLAQKEGSFIDEVPNNINIIPLHIKNRNHFRTISSIPVLVKYLKEKKPDTLLSALHGNIIAVWARNLAKSSTRLVLTEHNTYSYQNQSLPYLIRNLNTWLVHRIYPKAQEIIAVSQGVAEDLSKSVSIDRDRIKVIYNPIITADFQKKTRENIDHPWFSNRSIPVIAAIGRLTKQKDFPLLLHAFQQVLKEKKARLMILGEGEEREELASLIEDLEIDQYVMMPGFVLNPYTYLSHATLFVLSSQWEGLPTVLVEAMACGVPVISTDCPSGPSEILRNGKYGRLVPVGDIESMRAAIIDGLDGKIPPAPPESWEVFTIQKTVDEYMEILFDHS